MKKILLASLFLLPCFVQGSVLISNFPITGTTSPQFPGDTAIAFGFNSPSIESEFDAVTAHFTFGLPGILSVGLFDAAGVEPGTQLVSLMPTSAYQFGFAYQDYTFVPETSFMLDASTNYFIVFELENPPDSFAQINWTVSDNSFFGTGEVNQGFLRKFGPGAWDSFSVDPNFSLEINATPIPEPRQAALLLALVSVMVLVARKNHRTRQERQ